MLKIRLLGTPEILRDGIVVKINRRKSRAVVYYIAGQTQPVQRAQLLELFWIDLPRPQALQTMRSTLYGLRRDLGNALMVEGEQIWFDDETDIDSRRFKSQSNPLPLDTQDLKSLVDLYLGDFLDSFSLPDSQGFEDWLTIEREHYRRLVIRALSTLSKHLEESGDFHNAIEALDRALAFDNLQEDLHRERIRVLYRSGDRPGAIRHYDHLRRLLDEEMGVPPMKETRDLYDALINDRLEVPNAHSLLPARRSFVQDSQAEIVRQIPFIGRQLELEHLEENLRSGKLLLIEGEPGIGKTRLAHEFMRKTGTLAITAASRELEHALPYLPWIEGLRALINLPGWPKLQFNIRTRLQQVWWRELIRLVPDLGGAKVMSDTNAREPDEARLWEGIHQFLLQLSAQTPVLIFLDDLQWSDAASLGLLGYLVRQDDLHELGFLATTRNILPGSIEAHLVQTLSRYGRLIEFQLDRLTKTDISTIAQRLTPAYGYPFAEWLQRNSEGNPFVLNELVRHLESAKILKPDGQIDLSALSATPLVPKSVYLLIQSRLGHLSDQARRFLDAAVAAGREFDLEIVARAAALSDEAAMDASGELENAGLIVPQADSHYRFDHTLTMEVAYQDIGEPRHRLMHRRIAEAMEGTLSRRRLDELAGEIAAHFIEGNAIQRAAPYAFRAGNQAARLAAWTEAADFYRQALSGLEGEGRYPVLMALGQTLMASGAISTGSDTYQEAYDLAANIGDRGRMDIAALAKSQALLLQSHYGEAAELASQVRSEGLPQNGMLAEFTWGSVLSLEGAHLDEAAEHLRRAQALCCGQSTKPEINRVNQARILFELGGIAAQRGELSEAIDLYRQVIDLACAAGIEGVMWCVLAHNNLAYHLNLYGDPSALSFAEIGLGMVQEHGLLELLPYLYSTLGEISLDQAESGQTAAFTAAENYFQRGLQLAERFEMKERIAGLTANLGRLEIKRGNPELAINHLTFALQIAESLGTRHQWAQIQLWLAPLLPAKERRLRMQAVREFAEEGGRKRLVDQIQQIEAIP